MRQFRDKGILVLGNCHKCPEYRQPCSYVRVDTGICVECQVPSKKELERWEIDYYDSTK